MEELRRIAGRCLVAGFPHPRLPSALMDASCAGELGGVVLFRRNIESCFQAHEIIDELKRHTPFPMLVAVDQEGGRVRRFRQEVLNLPPMRHLGQGTKARTQRLAKALGQQLNAIGFNMNFAPVMDVDSNPDNPVIGDRAFSREPEMVVAHAQAFVDGLHEGGVLACGKHFPGHGDTDQDSHLALPRLPHDMSRLRAVELFPFANVSRLPAIMTAHVVFDALDPKIPATLSKKVLQGLLREDMGFDGAIISDDLEMKAISAGMGVADAAVSAIEAGCDILLICSDFELYEQALEALVLRAASDVAFHRRLTHASARAETLYQAGEAMAAPIDEDRLSQHLSSITSAHQDVLDSLGTESSGIDPTERA